MKFNTHKISRYITFLFVILAAAASSVLADDVPSWLQEAAKQPNPQYDVVNVPAVVLRNEQIVTVNSDGSVTRVTRYAIRVLVRDGRREAVADVIYETDSQKVRDLNAWIIRRSGPSKSYGKKEIVDVALAANDLYNEARVKVINGTDDVAEGDVFGYESVTEERTVFSQFQFGFQDNLPVLDARFALNVPNGWKAEGVSFNTTKIEPVTNGSSYVWEMRDLAPIPPESGSPSRASTAPRLAVSFFPVGSTATQIQTFANWSDVARWMSEIEDPQMTVDDALAGKAKDLTANATTEFERIRAIARYVQQIQYISIQIGTGRGGGYRPHSATEIFAKSYGDCKDKANLMRAMLSVLRITSYMVSITADDATYVRPEWASPHQFNHCIIAIKVSDETKAPSIVVHPTLGRLMIFDATDPYTPLGDLPEDEQGSFALIDHKDTDRLIQMPIIPAEMNGLERTVEMTLDPTGGIVGKLNESSTGQSATRERAVLRQLSASDYNKMIEGWLTRGATGAKAGKIETRDNHDDGKFNLNVEFSALSYAQIMQGKLMVFKPAMVSRTDRSFTNGKRYQPYVVNSSTYSENVKIRLPNGFTVDELPDPTTLETSFGKYSASYTVTGDVLTFTRSMKLSHATIAADKYDLVRKFFSGVRAAEQAPVVLLKK
ncbi:MAG: DUF3857 and transglutaminase domain-containing protein [Acidobacteriota bacterium]